MKATLRKDGCIRVTVRLKAHIGFDDVVLALIDHHGLYGWELTEGRTATWKMVRQFVATYGDYGWSSVSSELQEQFKKECVQRARELFPELINEVALKNWADDQA